MSVGAKVSVATVTFLSAPIAEPTVTLETAMPAGAGAGAGPGAGAGAGAVLRLFLLAAGGERQGSRDEQREKEDSMFSFIGSADSFGGILSFWPG